MDFKITLTFRKYFFFYLENNLFEICRIKIFTVFLFYFKMAEQNRQFITEVYGYGS